MQPIYKEKSLTEAINQLADQLIGNLKTSIEVNLDEDHVRAGVKNEIYLIVQEALRNIKFHAQAERAEIHVETFPDRIHLFIQDDGRGFSLEQITKRPNGLIQIQNRVMGLGGTYELETTTAQGVAHSVYIPLIDSSVSGDYTTSTRLHLQSPSSLGFICSL